MSISQLNQSQNAGLHRLREEREALALQIEKRDQNIMEIEHATIQNTHLPLLALPTEVTCIIFQYAVEYPTQSGRKEGRIYYRGGQEEKLPEVAVSHVCHQWRSISLSYPRLWATFSFSGFEVSRRPLDRLEAYLKRSRSQALDLSFDFRGVYLSIDDNRALLGIIIPHLERWKRFTLISDGTDDNYHPLRAFLADIEVASAPHLEHFAFDCDLHDPGTHTSDPVIISLEPGIFTKGAPKLQSVLLDCSHVACLPPISNITTLRLEAIDHHTVLQFSASAVTNLLMLPSLANLSLAGMCYDFGVTGIITMANLIHLRFCGEYAPNLLPYLRAPLLQTLIIQEGWLPELEDFAEPYTFPSLRSVSLHDAWATDSGTWSFATITAMATEVLFSPNHSHDNLFTMLQDREEMLTKTYWTKLKIFTCIVRTADTYYIKSFLQFLKGRPEKNDLVLRIFDRLDVHWRQTHPSEYEALAKLCTIETMDSRNNPLVQNWPPGECHSIYMLDHDNPFRISPPLLNLGEIIASNLG